MSRFTHDNNFYFEFHPYVCYVKDKDKHANLNEETLKQGLYEFNFKAEIAKENAKLCVTTLVLMINTIVLDLNKGFSTNVIGRTKNVFVQ